MGWVRYFFGFGGRINRTKFWLYYAIALPALVALFVVFYVYAMSFPGAYENGGPTPLPADPLGIAGAILWALAFALLLVASLAITVKRLHDRGKRGWWLLVFAVLPNLLYGGQQYLLETDDANAGSATFLLSFFALALWAWGLLELGVLQGNVGANRFGPDPLTSIPAL
jgi:uncharacterized membrane protein YhaH (DUF805 family)